MPIIELKEKGKDIPPEKAQEVWKFLHTTGQEELGQTAFVQQKDFLPLDIDKMHGYYQRVLDYQEQLFGTEGAVFNRSLREHLGLGERLCDFVSNKMGYDPNKFKALFLIHDFGRMFSHRRGRNDVLGEILEKKIGIREVLTNLLPSDSLWKDLDQKSIDQALDKMKTADGGIRAALTMVDVMAKWKPGKSGTLRRWEDIVPQTNKRQIKPMVDNAKDAGMSSVEFHRQKAITSTGGKDYVGYKYTNLKEWLEGRLGGNLDDFIEEVEQSLHLNPIPRDWK